MMMLGLMQEMSQFVHVVRAKVAPEQVTHEVQRRVRDAISQAQHRNVKSLDYAARPPLPEVFDARRRKPLGMLVPKTKMNFNSEWKVRIVVITSPLPIPIANHRGQMIGALPIRFDGRESGVNHRVAR